MLSAFEKIIFFLNKFKKKEKKEKEKDFFINYIISLDRVLYVNRNRKKRKLNFFFCIQIRKKNSIQKKNIFSQLVIVEAHENKMESS